MDILYKIIGIRSIGNRISLTLKPLEQKEKLETTKILTNLGGFMDNMKAESMISRNPDQISIPLDNYKEKKYQLGDMISIKIEGGQT